MGERDEVEREMERELESDGVERERCGRERKSNKRKTGDKEIDNYARPSKRGGVKGKKT
jgi:hypothetical protein